MPPAWSPVSSTGARTPPAPASTARVGNIGNGSVLSGPWPLQDTLELGPLPGSVPCARLHTRHVLREWGLARLSENAELLVTELMTNAIAASRPAAHALPVRLWLLADPARVLTLVWDASSRPPLPATPGHDTENGRGLLLVQAISQRWDWYYPEQAGGKIVWALLEAPLQLRRSCSVSRGGPANWAAGSAGVTGWPATTGYQACRDAGCGTDVSRWRRRRDTSAAGRG